MRDYGPVAHPLAECCDNAAERITAFAGLNGESRPGTLIDAIYSMPVSSAPASLFALWQFVNASRGYAQVDGGEHSSDIVARTALADIEAAAAQTPLIFFTQSMSDIDDALASLDNIDTELVALFADEAPSTAQIAGALVNLRQALITLQPSIAIDRPSPANGPGPADSPQAVNVDTVMAAVMSAKAAAPIAKNTVPITTPNAGLQTREQAIHELRALAQFFRQAEPHSPISYGIDKLVRWALMPLPELMSELISDDVSRTQFAWMTGVDLAQKR
jgi:type VI secretion system protein ImpA